MKAVCFSLLLLLLACSFGEGLKCNRCVGKGCRNTVETCRIDHDTCGTVIFKPPLPISYFKRCMKMSECRLLGSNKDIDAYCCTSNQCN
ncbi:hypothetical protein J4Q44_G00045480 [Coregonus suidteri]|uniref:Uncharacterized protein n=1 Tax=Coregonus suidteri TaxID=861788 RepID=A0AAN8R4P0_9TELE